MTLEDLASAAGVSKATVSRVINQRGNVSEATARRVREVMIRTQFPVPEPKPLRRQPSAPRRSQASTTGAATASISAHALLVPEISGDLYISLLHGFEAACQQRGRKTIVCNTQDNALKQADDILQLIHSNVRGIAIVPVASSPTPAAHLTVLRTVGIPVVLLHRDVEGVDVPLIALPLRKIGIRAGDELISRGHRRIAMFTSQGSASGGVHRAGLEESLRRADLSLPESLVCPCVGAIPLSMRTLEENVAGFVARLWLLPDAPRPTGVYVTSNVIAEVLYLKLAEHGLKVGVDVSILTFGASERAGPINSRLSSIVVDEFRIGQSAVELLEPTRPVLGEIPRSAGRVLLHAELSFSAGESLGPAPE